MGDFFGSGVADNECAFNATFFTPVKAMTVDSFSRIACTSPGCSVGGETEHVDWVLYPSTLYIGPGDEPILTDANGLFLFPFAVPQFAPTIPETWTGLNADWTTGDNCSDWSTTAGNGLFGDVNAIDISFVSWDSLGCDQPRNILCVEQ